MLKRKSLIAAAIAAAFALPFGAYAAGTDRPSGSAPGASGATSPSAGAPSMKSLDTNSDGFVSKEEAKKDRNVSQRFNELDKDKDGKLSATEMNAAQSPAAGGATTPKSSSAQGSATEGKRGNGSGSGGSR